MSIVTSAHEKVEQTVQPRQQQLKMKTKQRIQWMDWKCMMITSDHEERETKKQDFRATQFSTEKQRTNNEVNRQIREQHELAYQLCVDTILR